MAIASKPFYWLTCDREGCGKVADYGDYVVAMDEQAQALEQALESEWTTDGVNHQCPDCPALGCQ